MRRGPLALAACALMIALAGCSAAAPGAGGTAAPRTTAATRPPAQTPRPTPSATLGASPLPTASPTGRAASPSPAPTPTPTASPAAGPLAGLSLEQIVGQLFMVGTTAAAAQSGTLADVTDLHVGGVFLSGRSTAGAAVTSAVTARLRAADRDGVPLLVSTDQEGGEVQVLRGAGFADIPSALAQAGTQPAALEASAASWGAQLRAAGVNMDLAPVADVVVSPAQASANPPIGQLDREYGYGEVSAAQHAGAFAGGMLRAGVVPTAKHFPGLGAVTQNTDFRAGVTDTTTTSSSPSVEVYRQLIAGGLPVVMVSTADYARIAPGIPAAFSPAVVTGLLRDSLGFRGVVITDDLSAAQQVAAWSPAQRAILSIAAGADIVLVSASPQVAPQMIAAVVAKARTDAAFRAQVDAAATRVLDLKRRYLPR